MKKSNRPASASATSTAMPAELGSVAFITASSEFSGAFHSIEHEVRAVDDAQLATINVDVVASVITARAALPALLKLRPALVRLDTFDTPAFDKLEVYARGLLYAHARYLTAMHPDPLPLAALAKACTDRVGALFDDVKSLVNHGKVPATTLAAVRVQQGYRPAAMDLVVLVEAVRSVWPEVAGHTALTSDALDAAMADATALLDALSTRERNEKATTEATELRLKTFTLFVHAYDEARRGVSFLRWHQGDAETIAPSFYAGRPTGHASAVEAPVTPPAPAAPAAPNEAMRAMSGDPASAPDLAKAMPKSPFVR